VLELFDAAGRRSATLVDGAVVAGWHDVWWSGRAADGRPVRSGVYFARLRAAGVVRSQRLVWIE